MSTVDMSQFLNINVHIHIEYGGVYISTWSASQSLQQCIGKRCFTGWNHCR